eukprot:TRINITY_DN5316_c0_g1_i1.p1 TRINITY_DN5316_c0_g1~~TRINITY_DN5316_c0_g1_i1.p1  ORF type:complete len:372 (-),score=78.76 TRINITY_DN5316_c0_g1_i1:186-1301(-)
MGDHHVKESVVTYQSKGGESDSDADSDSGSDSSEPRAPRSQPRLNEYVLKQTLGKGAYGVVKLVEDTTDHVHYAMKCINCKELNKKHRFSRSTNTPQDKLKREIAIMKKLDHPNIVNLLQVIDDATNQMLYLVMELVDGGVAMVSTTEQVEPLSEDLARKYIRDAIRGIHYIHTQGIIHNDIKPENMLVTNGGLVKISDFGVSHIFDGDDDTIQRTEGTIAFHAPEMCTGQPFRGKPIDVWALGCTLYHFVQGALPFWADGPVALYDMIKTKPLEFVRPCSAGVQDLLRRMLDRDAAARITLEQAALHPWITNGDREPLSLDRGHRVVVTDADIRNAVVSIDHVILLSKIKTKMTRLVSRVRANLLVRSED